MFKKDKIIKVIKIEGMTCNHCKKRVEEGLKSLKEVRSASANLDHKEAVVEMKENIENDVLKNAINELGYTVIDIN